MVGTPARSVDASMLEGHLENLTGPRCSTQVRARTVKAECGARPGNTLPSRVAGLDRP